LSSQVRIGFIALQVARACAKGHTGKKVGGVGMRRFSEGELD